MTIPIFPGSHSCNTLESPSSLLPALWWSNHLRWWPSSTIKPLSSHTWATTDGYEPQGPELCGGLWQKGHLWLLVPFVLPRHQLCAACMATQLPVSQMFGCFTDSFHPCPWVQSRPRDVAEWQLLVCAPVWWLRLCFWVKLVTTPFPLREALSSFTSQSLVWRNVY